MHFFIYSNFIVLLVWPIKFRTAVKGNWLHRNHKETQILAKGVKETRRRSHAKRTAHEEIGMQRLRLSRWSPSPALGERHVTSIFPCNVAF
jgi:hypothetical protein